MRRHLEHHIESRLCERVKALGGIPYKFTSPQRRSVPDRMCAMPGGRIVFVECKAPGKKPTEKQLLEHARLRKLGFCVEVVDTYERVHEVFPILGKW